MVPEHTGRGAPQHLRDEALGLWFDHVAAVAQYDMLFALLGAATYLVLLTRAHDRFIPARESR
jgi:uncharacterized membrane protein YjdF